MTTFDKNIQNLCPLNWHYTGLDDGYHIFQSGNYRDGFREMRLLNEDLTVKNIDLMIKLNMTR
jgi:hypothetical protein